MDTHINLWLGTGTVAHDPRLTEDGGKRCVRFTLMQEDPPYCTYVPIECYGRLVDECTGLTAGQYIGVEGRLKWAKYHTKAGEKSGLVVMARDVRCLRSPAPTPALHDN